MATMSASGAAKEHAEQRREGQQQEQPRAGGH